MMKTAILPFAAFCTLALSPAGAAELRPDQKAAVEEALANVEPSMREAARPQIEQTVAMLNKAQVAMMVAGLEENAKAEAAPDAVEEDAAPVSPQDLAYNRRQYEPAIRAGWKAQKAFDDFVEAEMAAKCSDRHKYAVVDGPARYELRALSPNWPRASWNAEADVEVIGVSYAPQDGRYDFDFSKVRTTFDKAKVSGAVAKACADWTKEAAAFQIKARALVDAKNSDGAFAFDRTASAKVEPIEAALVTVLNAEAPSGDYALLMALQNGERVK